MKLKILGPNYYKTSLVGPSYRGVERPSPTYVSELSGNHQANRLFFESLNYADTRGIFQDINFCHNYLSVLKQVPAAENFELVELTLENSGSITQNSQILGFDIACVYRISLLSWGLVFEPKDDVELNNGKIIQPFIKLIEAHFNSKLNEHGLFTKYSVASLFLESMLAVQQLDPNRREGEDCEFRVIGVWKVKE